MKTPLLSLTWCVLLEKNNDDTILGDDGKYHNRVPLNLSESDLNNFISYKMLECTKSMDAKMKTVKGIMVFWVTLTLVQLILGFVIYLLIKNAFPF